MKLPDEIANDEKEEQIRVLSPADLEKQCLPKIPSQLRISRLVGDGAEFVPDAVTQGLKERLQQRR